MRVKICGLTRAGDVAAAADAGAAYLGFVFHPASPRHLDLGRAAQLAATVPPGIAKVALLVDPDDATLDAILESVPVDVVQLHGRESPARVAVIRSRAGLPVMKALGIGGPEDLAVVAAYESVADMLLLDARPPRNAWNPGGHGRAFDWNLIAGQIWRRPWMLAGGLTPGNVAEAVRATGAGQVDVSSGVEDAPGLKSATRIRAFLAALA